ncbi:GPW/gp25 family protein [Nocardia amamiensis]|uniref:GPW/gp25 family protein n=1 Tax=Nocardia amamiensis TaxID=404578 RepID=UPI0033D4D8B4
MSHVAFPLRLSARGRTTLATDDEYVRGLIEVVLFTRLGERVNRPDFGSRVDRLMFAPAGDEIAQMTKAMVHSSLQRLLGELIQVEDVVVRADDAILRVTVVYAPLSVGAGVGEQRSVTVSGGVQ